MPRRHPLPLAAPAALSTAARSGPTLALACAVALGAAGCSPAMNWRELRPEGSGAVLMLPCKPASHARRLPLAGAATELTLYACSAGEVTWAIAFAALGDPARVGAALAELRAAATANLDAGAVETLPLRVEGATPNPASVRLAFSGRLSDGRAVQEQMAVFTKGTRVYQATCVGAQLPADGVETFFGALRTPA